MVRICSVALHADEKGGFVVGCWQGRFKTREDGDESVRDEGTYAGGCAAQRWAVLD
jgi:hypothetical protein